jgi:hypothetical membrane protein
MYHEKYLVYVVSMSIQRKQGVLLALGAAGPVIFIAGYLINGATQPGYSSWHDTISTLSLARHGWIQVANFMLYGALTLCFAEGLRRSGAVKRWGFGLLVTAGLGLLVIGPFRTDPILGFPVGEPSVVTSGGTVHNMSSLLVFLAFPAAVLVTTRRPFRGWAAFSIASSVLSVLAVVVYFAIVSAAHGHQGGDSPAGFFERLPTLFIGLWQVALVYRLLTGKYFHAQSDQSGPRVRRRLRGGGDGMFRPAGSHLDPALRGEEGS